MTDIVRPEPGDDGRIPADEISAYLTAVYEAEYEEGRAVREALTAKKKKAVDELLALGVSKESAYFLVDYTEQVPVTKIVTKKDTKET